MTIESYITYGLYVYDKSGKFLEKKEIKADILPRKGEQVDYYISKDLPRIYTVKEITHHLGGFKLSPEVIIESIK